MLLEEGQQHILVDDFRTSKLGNIAPQDEGELEGVKERNPVQNECNEVFQHANKAIDNYKTKRLTFLCKRAQVANLLQ